MSSAAPLDRAPPEGNSNDRPLRIAAMISGGGRTLENLADEIERGKLIAEIVLVIASRGGIAGIERARERGIEVHVARRSDFDSEDALHEVISGWLRDSQPDLICLCGYLRHVRIEPWMRGRVMNIHPALLPDFGGRGMHGMHVHEAVLAAGRKESGCTVHFVDEEYDHGPIILQRRCPVRPRDTPETLAARVFEEERIAYPEAIRLFQEGRLQIEGDRVRIVDDDDDDDAKRTRRT